MWGHLFWIVPCSWVIGFCFGALFKIGKKADIDIGVEEWQDITKN